MQGFAANAEIHKRMRSSVSGLPSLPVFNPDSDDCNSFKSSADLLEVKPYDLGLIFTISCGPTNDYCKQLSSLINNCSAKLDSEFYNPLVIGFTTGQTYVRGIYGDFDSSASVRSGLPSVKDDCSSFQETARVLDLEPYGFGLIQWHFSVILQTTTAKRYKPSSIAVKGIPYSPLNAGFTLGITESNRKHDKGNPNCLLQEPVPPVLMLNLITAVLFPSLPSNFTSSHLVWASTLQFSVILQPTTAKRSPTSLMMSV